MKNAYLFLIIFTLGFSPMAFAKNKSMGDQEKTPCPFKSSMSREPNNAKKRVAELLGGKSSGGSSKMGRGYHPKAIN